MTIPKGAKAKGISIPVVIAELIKMVLKLLVICQIFFYGEQTISSQRDWQYSITEGLFKETWKWRRFRKC